MEKQESRRQWLKRKLLSRYRLVILNEESFEEQLYFRLTRLNVIIITTFLFSLFFGGRKIPELMRGLGSGIKEFKKATKEEEESGKEES